MESSPLSNVSSSQEIVSATSVPSGFLILLLLVCILGLIGNAISVTIFTRPAHNSAIDAILLYLATADSLLLVVMLFMQSVGLARKWTKVPQEFITSVFPIAATMGSIALTCSEWLITAMSLERHFIVCYPLRARRVVTRRNALYIIATIAVVSVTANLFHHFFLEEAPEAPNSSEMAISSNSTTSVMLTHEVSKTAAVVHFLMNTIDSAIPIGIVFFCNVHILIKISEANKSRANLTSHKSEDINLTKTLLSVAFIFLTTNITNLAIAGNYLINQKRIIPLEFLSNFMYTLNSAINFLIYVLTGKKFRNEVYQLLFPSKHVQMGASSLRRYDTTRTTIT